MFKTSHEIGYEWHVRHQAAFQRSTDNGVSKTINLPNDATEEDVASAYRLAWELGCLGITVFRDGCKGEQVLHVGIKDKPAAVPAASGPVVVKPRPHSLSGRTYRSETPIGTAFITVNETAEEEPFEVFVQVGKGGSDTMAVAEALGRLISLTLRLPSPMSPQRRLEEVISQLSRIGGAQPLGFGKGKVLSLPDALARTLAEHTGQLKPTVGGAAGRTRARPASHRRSLQGVRPGDVRLRGRLQEVPLLRLQRVLSGPGQAGERGSAPPSTDPVEFPACSPAAPTTTSHAGSGTFSPPMPSASDPRMEIVMEAGGDLEGRGYRARGCGSASASSEPVTLDYHGRGGQPRNAGVVRGAGRADPRRWRAPSWPPGAPRDARVR